MLDKLQKILQKKQCSLIELTVSPKNTPSRKLFEKNGFKNKSGVTGSITKIDELICAKDYYGPGRDFIIFHKKI